MIKSVSAAGIILMATAAAGQEARQLDAHEHGVGQLDIAFDGNRIAMELHAPGADIVGFEYEAESSEDRARVAEAVARLARPLELFALPEEAGCRVAEAAASLESEEGHEEHDEHDDHEGHDENDDHADHDEHDDHEGHDEHDDHADHDEHDKHDDHDDHAAHDDHKDHTDGAGHSEFHAEYLLECTDATQATFISFEYFDAFPNALELEVQVISAGGATAFEVGKDTATLDLSDLF